MHAGVDIQSRKQRIERAGGGVHHKSVVQPFVRNVTLLTFNVAVFLVDLRGLRESGLLFMHGLRHQNTRIVFIQIQQQRGTIRHHWDKLFIADPCGIKQNVVAEMTNFIDHLAGVINGAVIGSQLNHRQTERALIAGAARRHFTHQLAQIIFFETVRVDTANKAVRVACSFQINRRRACLNERAVVVRFVIIAVKKH
ncbi:hypothetical protein D3C80_853990 [compost metagenome]